MANPKIPTSKAPHTPRRPPVAIPVSPPGR
jgi:hypothetical protein